MKIFIFIIPCLILVIFTYGHAEIINVPAHHSTIQAGIDAATDGDTVLVQPGTYDEHTDFSGKNIVLGSLFLTTGNPSYISNTVIGGNVWGSVVQFSRGEDSTAVLCGFTLTGAQRFGGIDCSDGSSPTLMNLIVTGNTARYSGGAGINCHDGGSPTLVNVTIIGNGNTTLPDMQPNGGGIRCFNSKMKLLNVTIADNSTNFGSFGGGGICCYESEMNLVNVTIVGNTAHNKGGAISCLGSEMILVNTIVWNNYPEQVFISEGSVDAFCCDISGFPWVFGNINADPLYIDGANGDFRLQEGSPCIDTGIQDAMIIYNDCQDTLFVPEMNYIGSAPDIGAYEYGDPLAIERETKTPKLYSLSQNYPNPFNPSTTIKFTLPKPEFVTLKVYNILGKEISTLVSQKLQAGSHTYKFDGSNLASGVYLYRIKTGELQQVRKMVMLK